MFITERLLPECYSTVYCSCCKCIAQQQQWQKVEFASWMISGYVLLCFNVRCDECNTCLATSFQRSSCIHADCPCSFKIWNALHIHLKIFYATFFIVIKSPENHCFAWLTSFDENSHISSCPQWPYPETTLATLSGSASLIFWSVVSWDIRRMSWFTAFWQDSH